MNFASFNLSHALSCSDQLPGPRQGGRHGQPPAEKQSRSQEAQEREDKRDRRRAEPKGRWLATDPVIRHEEIADRRAPPLRRVIRLLAIEDALQRLEVTLR